MPALPQLVPPYLHFTSLPQWYSARHHVRQPRTPNTHLCGLQYPGGVYRSSVLSGLDQELSSVLYMRPLGGRFPVSAELTHRGECLEASCQLGVPPRTESTSCRRAIQFRYMRPAYGKDDSASSMQVLGVHVAEKRVVSNGE